MTQSVKKKSKKKSTTAQAITSGGSNVKMKTFEIRKRIKAANIVDAFNLDQITPPDYMVMLKEEDEEDETVIGFKS